MLGGPFIDYDGKREDDVKELRDRTKQERTNPVELSNAIDELNSMLRTKANGLWMHPLYHDVPDRLRGYV